VNAKTIPAELRERPQWVLWRTERRDDRTTKVPYQPARPGTRASSTTSTTWGTYEQAVEAAADADGIGFVFSTEDPYLGVDLDGCVDPATGELDAAAAEIVAELSSYSEVSPSGAGMHVIVLAALPDGKGRETKRTPWRHEDRHELALYSQGRFFTITGGSGTIAEAQEQIDRLLDRYFTKASANGSRDRSQSATDAGGIARSVPELLREHPSLARIAAHKPPVPKDASQSGWDHYLACEGVRCGLSDSELDALIRHTRQSCPETRAAYVQRTITAARASVDADRADPAGRISRRWNLGDDPIVSGSTVGDVAGGGAVVYLETRSGRRLRFPRLRDLFEPAKHTRIVSLVTRSRFLPVTNAEATELAQLVIELCGGQDIDPLTEARGWVTDFIAHAGATVNALKPDGTPKKHWELLSEHGEAELALLRSTDPARRSAIIISGDELWLPAGALMESSGTRMSGPDFVSAMAEIEWRHKELYATGPGSRADRASGNVQRIHRRFYVGRIDP
jgi:hypothetical protein